MHTFQLLSIEPRSIPALSLLNLSLIEITEHSSLFGVADKLQENCSFAMHSEKRQNEMQLVSYHTRERGEKERRIESQFLKTLSTCSTYFRNASAVRNLFTDINLKLISPDCMIMDVDKRIGPCIGVVATLQHLLSDAR